MGLNIKDQLYHLMSELKYTLELKHTLQQSGIPIVKENTLQIKEKSFGEVTATLKQEKVKSYYF
jgi:hypothetical protein